MYSILTNFSFMQVILIKPVRKLGKVGKIVRVKNGYGRNFLIPRNLVIRATKENLEKFSTIQKNLETKNTTEKLKMETAAKALDGKHLIFVTQSGADGRLFGSISLKLLAASLSKLIDYKLSYANVMVDNPIKSNGVFKIQVILHPEISVPIIVIVAKSDSEAQDALHRYKENEKTINEEISIDLPEVDN